MSPVIMTTHLWNNLHVSSTHLWNTQGFQVLLKRTDIWSRGSNLPWNSCSVLSWEQSKTGAQVLGQGSQGSGSPTSWQHHSEVPLPPTQGENKAWNPRRQKSTPAQGLNSVQCVSPSSSGAQWVQTGSWLEKTWHPSLDNFFASHENKIFHNWNVEGNSWDA